MLKHGRIMATTMFIQLHSKTSISLAYVFNITCRACQFVNHMRFEIHRGGIFVWTKRWKFPSLIENFETNGLTIQRNNFALICLRLSLQRGLHKANEARSVIFASASVRRSRLRATEKETFDEVRRNRSRKTIPRQESFDTSYLYSREHEKRNITER